MSPTEAAVSLSRRSLGDQVADALVDLILEQGLHEGDSLPSTAELSERFGVSRTVVREALAALSGRGILTRSQGRECVVATPGSDELHRLLRLRIRRDEVGLADILDTRMALEVMSARMAAQHATDVDKAQIHSELDALVSARNEPAYHEADIALHRAIAVASQNRLLVLILDALVDFLREVRVQATRARKARGESLDPIIEQHRRIVKAIDRGAASAAADAMRDHLNRTKAELD